MKNTIDKNYIADNVLDLFGEANLAAAFITGGAATEHGTDNCDIDLLICHRDPVDSKRRSNFTKFYLDLHNRTNRIPDLVSPGEVMPVENMRQGLARISMIEPTRVLDRRDDFDFICWAGMLVSKKQLIIAPTPELAEFESIAHPIINRWAGDLCDESMLTLNTGLPTDMDKALARIMSCPGYYEAHE